MASGQTKNKITVSYRALEYAICLIGFINFITTTMSDKCLTVCVTGAAGQTAYSLLPQLCRGLCFPEVKLNLHLLDVTNALKTLKGIVL